MKSKHSKSCLPENVCKFLFACYAFAYVASVSMLVGVRSSDIRMEQRKSENTDDMKQITDVTKQNKRGKETCGGVF
ncbi:hypothetical protein T11_10995 [Trichinella zimbabwensis]|uniref:Transmembrane protein n=1 Tax=Trichinella zimbabwensis TaxID=268475 RepID=A0A0V1HCP8_9BILA|nr:hypothetical protein T11_10995 [Trichinella zimbabwensis]